MVLALSAGSAVAQSTSTTSGSSGSSSSSSTTGVTKDTITLSVTAPYSGVYKVIGTGLFATAELWRDEVNAAGGIHGRKIELKQVDNQFTPEGAVAGCKEVQTNGSFIDVNQIDSGDQVGCEDKAGIPVFANASGLGAKAIKSYRYVTIGRGAPEHPKTEVSFLGSKYVNAKGKKIGLIQGQGPAFTAWYVGLRKELKQQGYDVVHVERTAPEGNQTSFVTEMQRMQQAGAEVVVLNTVLEGPGIIRDAKAIGYTPQFVMMATSQDNAARATFPVYDGVIGLRFQTTSETPAYKAYVEKMRAIRGEEAAKTTNTTNALAYGLMDALGAALKAAGPNLTRESFVKAAHSLENYDEVHLVGPFTTKGAALPIGEHAMFPSKCCNPDHTFMSTGPAEEIFPAAKSK